MLRCLVLVALVVSVSVHADMIESKSRAKMAFAPPPPAYPIALTEVQAYFQGIKKTRELNPNEMAIDHLANVAATLKVATITSMSKEVAHTNTTYISNAIHAKIKENPKWDTQLSAAQIQSITSQQEMIKKNFGDKSYVWAWFLKQTGKTTEAKQILNTLFDERCASVMKIRGTFNRQSPMLPVMEVEQALLPLSTDSEKAMLQKKMQELKVHVSNLEDYMIKT